jgi:hypothetical protein
MDLSTASTSHWWCMLPLHVAFPVIFRRRLQSFRQFGLLVVGVAGALRLFAGQFAFAGLP